MERIKVEFLKSCSPYTVGEIATFNKRQVDILVRNKTVRVLDQEKTEIPDRKRGRPKKTAMKTKDYITTTPE